MFNNELALSLYCSVELFIWDADLVSILTWIKSKWKSRTKVCISAAHQITCLECLENASNCCTIRLLYRSVNRSTNKVQLIVDILHYHLFRKWLSDTKHPVHTGAMLHRPHYPETQTEHFAVGRERAAESVSVRQLSNTDPGTETIRTPSNMIGPGALLAPFRMKTPFL